MTSTRTKVIHLYKNLLFLGRDYPKGYDYFKTRLKEAFLKNKDVKDKAQIEILLTRGQYIIKELEALYMLKKYRTLKKSYWRVCKASLPNMPQEFQVLRCSSCEIFQVHQTKKATKWACKVCGEKQPLKRAFMIGSSCDCRKLVQKLNLEAGEQKVNSVHNQNTNNLEKSEDFDSLGATFNESFEPLNNFELEGSENKSSSETFEEYLYIPKKKQRCDMYSQYEASSENKPILSYSTNDDFAFHDENQAGEIQPVEHSQSTSSSEPDISFDVGFNLDSENSLSTEQRTSITAIDNRVDNLSLPSETPLKLSVPKNRGFQLILKAAQGGGEIKLASTFEIISF